MVIIICISITRNIDLNAFLTIQRIIRPVFQYQFLSQVFFISYLGNRRLNRMRNEDTNCWIFFMIVSETIDLILDWDFVYEINKSSENVDEISKQLIRWFAIWGTILYFLTVVSLCCDLCNDEDKENPCSPSLSLLSTVTEDFPQIILAIVVARHTTHLISLVQIAKAVYGLIEPFIRAVKISAERENSKKKFSTESHDYECQKFFDMIFCILLCVCSFALFVVLILPAN